MITEAVLGLGLGHRFGSGVLHKGAKQMMPKNSRNLAFMALDIVLVI